MNKYLQGIVDQFKSKHIESLKQGRLHEDTHLIYSAELQNHFCKRNQQTPKIFKTKLIPEGDYLLNITKMLISEDKSIPTLHVNLQDTIFFVNDIPFLYVYFNDQKQTLERIYNKSNKNTKIILEKFVARKSQSKGTQRYLSSRNITDRQNKKDLTCKSSQRVQRKRQVTIALLKYKQKFQPLEINQSDFTSILQNPMYAHTKFKQSNNTLCIQKLPCENLQIISEQYQIEFNDQQFSKQILYELASEYICKFSSNRVQIDENQEIIGDMNTEVMLYYIVFKMVVFFKLHYQKRILHSIFKFVKNQKCKFALVCVQNLNIENIPQDEYEYIKIDLFELDSTPKHNPKQMGQVYQNALQVFDQYNKKIEVKINKYITETKEFIENSKDQQKSNQAFVELKNNSDYLLKDILNNPFLLKKLIKNTLKN